jgi:hypothetical protein
MKDPAFASWCDGLPPLLRSANCLYTVGAVAALSLLLAFHQVVQGSAERAALQRQAWRDTPPATFVATTPQEPQR